MDTKIFQHMNGNLLPNSSFTIKYHHFIRVVEELYLANFFTIRS